MANDESHFLAWITEEYTDGGQGKIQGREWDFFVFFFRIVKFSNRMESKGRTERGVLVEKISKETCKEGSAKEGEVMGLQGGEEIV